MLVCKAVHLSPPLPAVIICLLVTDTFPPYTLHIPDILHHRWTLAFVKAQTSVQPYSFLIGSLVELSSTDTSAVQLYRTLMKRRHFQFLLTVSERWCLLLYFGCGCDNNSQKCSKYFIHLIMAHNNKGVKHLAWGPHTTQFVLIT